MAYEMKIRGTEDEVKIRSPWAAALLPIVTLGIYHLVWWYRINRELRDYGKAKGYDLGQNPTNSVLALFPGGIIIVPALITYWRGIKRVMGASRLGGKEPLNGWIAIILYLLLSPGALGLHPGLAQRPLAPGSRGAAGPGAAAARLGPMPPPLPPEQQPPPAPPAAYREPRGPPGAACLHSPAWTAPCSTQTLADAGEPPTAPPRSGSGWRAGRAPTRR